MSNKLVGSFTIEHHIRNVVFPVAGRFYAVTY